MNKSQQLLSDITVYTKYARYRDESNRRENWNEIVDRYLRMMIKKYPNLNGEILQQGKFLYEKHILMSMRAAQFAGPAIEKNESRIYNCAYLPIDDYRAFSETMFLLLGGTGVGFSVQFSHIEKLPEIQKPKKEQKFVIGDSIEGWADAVKALMKSYFGINKVKPRFDFTDIRPKGERLITAGGKAPGPAPLRTCLAKIEGMLENKEDGDKLTSLEVHDIICHIADAVLAGGIRRAALISLFSADDSQMASCKAGNWWELNPQRGRANNSAVLLRHRITKSFFLDLWKKIEASGSGEPGIYLTNDKDWGTNPCCLSEDSLLLTDSGYKKIKNLINKEDLKLVNKNGEVVEGKVWLTGQKRLYAMHLGNTKDPTIIKATEDHVFMLNNGEEEKTINLKGKRLMPFYTIKNSPIDIQEVKYGFVFGDGSFRKNPSTFKNIQCSFTPGKDDEVKRLFNKTGWSTSDISFTVDISFKELKKRGIDTSKRSYERELPDVITADFLAGLYSANGSVVSSSRVVLKTTSKEVAKKLVDTLSLLADIPAYITTNKAKYVKFNNGTYKCKESYDINISSLKGIISFAKYIGFIQTYKNEALEKAILQKAPYVYNVECISTHDVYDFSLFDDTHWGVVNGIVTHNCEVALRPFQFCNLTEINAGIDYHQIALSTIHPDDHNEIELKSYRQEILNDQARAAAFFGTLQAGFTDFHYLRPIWRKTTEKEALIGVGITGICENKILDLDLSEAAHQAVQVNKMIAEKIDIKSAARVTTIKPSGTTSCVVGTSSGIHAAHSEYYIRNIQCKVGDDLFNLFSTKYSELIKVMDQDPNSAVIGIPIRSSDNAILREDEDSIEMLERVKRFQQEWVRPGHQGGNNRNNVSATVYIDGDNEYCVSVNWETVGEWMWDNRHYYNGLSVLPYDGGTYADAPFMECTEEVYLQKMKYIEENSLNLEEIIEKIDNTDLSNEIACSGNSCEII